MTPSSHSTTGSRAAVLLQEFHEHPNIVGTDGNSRWLRLALHREEHRELEDELAKMASWDVLKIARELADVVYVAYGTAYVFGIDLDEAIEEIHRAAMDKVRANLRRRDGKVMRPPGFRPPSLTHTVSLEPPEDRARRLARPAGGRTRAEAREQQERAHG